MVCLSSQALGMCISAVAPEAEIAMALFPIIFIPLMLLGKKTSVPLNSPQTSYQASPIMITIERPLTACFFLSPCHPGGFFLNENSIPDWLIWLKYFSMFRYGFVILARNEFEGLTFTCSTQEMDSDGTCPVSST